MAAIQLAIQQPEMPLAEEEFAYFCATIKEIAGIHLAPAKKQLVHGRVRQRVMELGLSSFEEYRGRLEKLPPKDPEWQSFVNLLTTNKTEFFREKDHFDFLRELLLQKNAEGKPVRIWCAAASTGEEPYTLAAVAHQALTVPFEILATDIDTDVLAEAAEGVYPAAQAQEAPEAYRKTTFDFGRNGIEEWMRIKPAVRDRVKFQRHNLIDPALPAGQPFDFIFCRNVLIYFTPETCALVMQKLHDAAAPGALAFIGHSESLQNLKTPWKSIRPSVYQKRLKP